MKRPSHKFLARAAFARDEHRGSARCGLRDQLEDLQHLRASTDDGRQCIEAAGPFRTEVPVLFAEPPLLDGIAEHRQHFLVLERLGDVVERPPLHGTHGGVHRCVGGDDQHGEGVVLLAESLEHLKAVDVWHHHVDDHGIEGMASRQREALGAAVRRLYGVTGPLQERLQYIAHHFLVVDDEHGATRRGGRQHPGHGQTAAG